MALRVVRGLFRLWLILSVLWVAGVAFVTWVDTFAGIDHAEVLSMNLWDRSEADAKHCLDNPPPGGMYERFLTPGCEDLDKGVDWKERRAETRSWAARQYRYAVLNKSVLALLPPAFVLMLGSALVWAFRGFR